MYKDIRVHEKTISRTVLSVMSYSISTLGHDFQLKEGSIAIQIPYTHRLGAKQRWHSVQVSRTDSCFDNVFE